MLYCCSSCFNQQRELQSHNIVPGEPPRYSVSEGLGRLMNKSGLIDFSLLFCKCNILMLCSKSNVPSSKLETVTLCMSKTTRETSPLNDSFPIDETGLLPK